MRSLKYSLLIALTLVIGLGASSAMADQAGLRTDLELVDLSDNGLVVLVSLTNTTAGDMFVLAYETPLQGLERDLFRIDLNGTEVPYLGRMATRIGPTPEDWVLIGAGETLGMKVDLSQSYDLQAAGTYAIQYHASQHVMTDVVRSELPIADLDKGLTEEMPSRTLSSDSLVVELKGAQVPAPFIPELEMDTAELSKDNYGSCPNTYMLSNAKSCGRSNALCGYYESASCNSWYMRWFDSCSYRSTVQNTFACTYNYLNSSWNWYCWGYYCSSGTIAYVYPSSPRNVYLCPLFYDQNSSYKCHAVFHEATHFCGTDDYTYGYSNSLNLNAPQSVYNADTYSYAADECN